MSTVSQIEYTQYRRDKLFLRDPSFMLNLTDNLVLDAFHLDLLLARVDARETCSHLRYLLYA